MNSSNYDRIRELFHQAVQLSADNRSAFLARKCGDDAELRASVDRLLKHHHPDTVLLESDRTSAPAPKNPDFNRTQRYGETVANDVSESAIGMLRRHTRALPGVALQRRCLLAGTAVGVGLLLATGWWLHTSTRSSLAYSLEVAMTEMVDHQVRAIETWLATEEELITSWARVPKVVEAVSQLNEIARTDESLQIALATSPAADELNEILSMMSKSTGAFNYAVWNREGTLLADGNADGQALLGNGTTEYGASLLSRVFHGDAVLWMPSRAGFITEGFAATENTPKGDLAMIAPVFAGDDPRPIAAILMSHHSRQQRFEDVLSEAAFGQTGEVYAFADDGYLISETRFDDRLKETGLIDGTSAAASSHIIRVADPGGNLVEGFTPGLKSDEWPLTRAVAAAVAGRSGSDINGYRNYRGVKVVGVWAWIERYRFGIVAEVNYDRAYEPLVPLQSAFGLIFAALLAAALAAVAASLALLRLRQNKGEVLRVGPYTLKSLLGEGGFARVYLANHALLRRSTAIKILKPEQINTKNLSRFEREVQLASGLTHPNTISIYDYGATTDGSFYYAMEYIKGVTLQELIDSDGPQCAARAIWILSQICRSLREAHNKGMIHRDIKPQNIMLCRRGGECDFVKVLDFGLARSLEAERNRITETKLLIGTPLYIAPERIVDPACMDPRSDIYSLGILGYFLLTGREPFAAVGSMDALAQTINRSARRPSEQTSRPIPAQLDQLIRDCHSRIITERPQTIEEVLQRMDAIELQEEWSTEKAAEWWDVHLKTMQVDADKPMTAAKSDETITVSRNP